MMTMLKEKIKKTGYSDIDSLLQEVHNLMQESAQVENQIKDALQFKPPVNPFKSNRRSKWFAFK